MTGYYNHPLSCLFLAAPVPFVCCVYRVYSSSSSSSLIPPTGFSLFFWLCLQKRICPSLPLLLFSFSSLTQSVLWFFSRLSLCLVSTSPAFGRELQSQLLFLELFQAHHDGILVYTGLSSAGHQSHTHQLLLHTSHQLRSADGPRGSQGTLWFTRARTGMGEIRESTIHHAISSVCQKQWPDFL